MKVKQSKVINTIDEFEYFIDNIREKYGDVELDNKILISSNVLQDMLKSEEAGLDCCYKMCNGKVTQIGDMLTKEVENTKTLDEWETSEDELEEELEEEEEDDD